MKKLILIAMVFTFFGISKIAIAQNQTQIVKGTVLDKQSQAPLLGVNIIIIGTDPIKGGTTDIDGLFKISDVAPGRYDLKLSYV